MLSFADDTKQTIYKYIAWVFGFGVLRMVETAPKKELFSNPRHPYTQALLSAVPVPQLHRTQKRIVLAGDVPSADAPPSGCPFHTRCRECQEICKTQVPKKRDCGNGHEVWCHFDFGK